MEARLTLNEPEQLLKGGGEGGRGRTACILFFFLISPTVPVSFVSYLGYSINHANILQRGFTL